ncbi:hypothetical protein [Aureimonas jatrophae]|jgi:hypothetical protein|uniref:Uncharacterized protein n=1 Tax=Aureimonas jatrophae TaxID=1166073 RepID=A0A1H0BUG4_9HYPH|nr:hypothetical protein [Aureimonas jatrophae]MBB3948934.1 uncharacterized protein (UPF0261 family) [Aureimonas jatrophae]SDN49230.1 hypothetical protein SAMN05192530_1015 [Aureimonas jatrophae]
MTAPVDPEISALIGEVIAADLLKPNSPELAVARLVATKGQGALDAQERDIFERLVLPILAKPLRDQVAIASILRRGGYVPRKIQY